MNWYDTNGQGASHPAGPRANCPDSMNGNAVMYDAVQGLILTVGGAPSYQVRSLRLTTKPFSLISVLTML